MDENWSTITLCIGNQSYALVPKQYFQEKRVKDYLNLSCFTNSSTYMYYEYPFLNVVVAFSMDSLLLSHFKAIYGKKQLYTIHQADCLLEGARRYLKSNKLSSPLMMLVSVEVNHLHIIGMQKNKLLYYNRFRYTNSNELLRYICIVIQTLKFDTRMHEISLSGITKDSLIHRKLCKHLRNVTLHDNLPYLKSKICFDKRVVSNHLDVLNTSICHRQHTENMYHPEIAQSKL